MSRKEWFESWFDSPYYHLLYHDRDEKEAQHFLDNLIEFLQLKPGSRILDVACGKGRHSLYLNRQGFEVTGYDLSPENIRHNMQFENETLSFHQHDMRKSFRKNYFDAVFNLFSSFGYFDEHRDNFDVVHAHANDLVDGGILVLDYMNSEKVERCLVREDTKECSGIRFGQKRKVSGKKIIKKISFSDQGKEYQFEEHLQLYRLSDFQELFSKNHLSLVHVLGDYSLKPFDQDTSDRLILIALKKPA